MTSSGKLTNFDQSDPVPLDPIILRARDELLEKYSDKSLEEQITFYKAVIEGEKDSLSRLSAMAFSQSTRRRLPKLPRFRQ